MESQASRCKSDGRRGEFSSSSWHSAPRTHPDSSSSVGLLGGRASSQQAGSHAVPQMVGSCGASSCQAYT